MSEKRKSVTGTGTGEEKPQHLLGGTAIKPPEHHGWDAVRVLLYEKETGKILTRTPKSWALITVFYVIYYSCLAAFWYGMLNLFFITLPHDEPKYQLDASIIGANPGVGMRPSQTDRLIDSAMIFLKKNAPISEEASSDGETESNADWAKRYQMYLEKYDNLNQTMDCSGENPEGGSKGKDACRFDVSVLGPCAEHPYGYLVNDEKSEKVSPCVLLKLNRIFGWMPEKYQDADLEKENMDPEDPIPDNVVELIKNGNRNKVYFDCRGENPFDREILQDKIEYFPSDQGIPFVYLPYNHAHKNYHNPLVAVRFNDLTPGTLHHVECKLWAKGIRHDKKDRIGLVHFEIILENEYGSS